MTWQLCEKVQQLAASAPPEARPSPQERRLHHLSLFLIVAPTIRAVYRCSST
jgi:hypothetical protein